MKEFKSDKVISIGSGAPNIIESTIDVSGIDQEIEAIMINLDIDHSYTADLRIVLIAPSGRGVTLVRQRGGSGNNFRNTVFDDSANDLIRNARPPFTGTYKPEGMLSVLKGENANGTWTLVIVDSARFDGGSLNKWSISISSQTIQRSNYSINVEFQGGLSATQMAIFTDSANRWSEVITSELSLNIEAKGVAIDGPRGVLGQAGPRSVKPGTLFPDNGIMEFDTADLAAMEADGSLLNVILHEMGHVIGIGTLWKYHGLLEGEGTENPLFVGPKAMNEYGVLLGSSSTKVPAANTGGAGTADSHWRETTFGNELMTGYADKGLLPLSRLTIAMLEDMEYDVNYEAVDPYIIPSRRMLMAMTAESAKRQEFHVTRPVCEGLPQK
jgi:Regulatory P domain of the subtilisin-like proprotein convertases and other proteases